MEINAFWMLFGDFDGFVGHFHDVIIGPEFTVMNKTLHPEDVRVLSELLKVGAVFSFFYLGGFHLSQFNVFLKTSKEFAMQRKYLWLRSAIIGSMKKQTIFFSGPGLFAKEKEFSSLDGVISVSKGFVNGTSAFPTEKEVLEGKASHAYSLKVVFLDNESTLIRLIELYLSFCPTDVKEPYFRRGIYYVDLLDAVNAEVYLSSKEEKEKVPVLQMRNFFPAK